MTNRFPLIIDTDNGAVFKELPAGDSLDLTDSSIINAAGLEVKGEALIDKLTIGSQTIDPAGTPGSTNNAPLSTVAFTGNYNDLSNLPNAGFTGSYNDLSDLPSIPSNIRDLNEVSTDTPDTNQALVWNDNANQYEPRDVVLELDLSDKSIRDLFDVSYIGSPSQNRLLKFSNGAWRPANVQYSEIQNRPVNVSFFNNDAGYITSADIGEIEGDFKGSVFSDDSTLLVDGVNSLINLKDTVDDDVIPKEANTVDLGSPEKPFRSLYLSDNTLILGDYALGINNGKLKLTNPGVDSSAEGLEVLDIAAEFVGVLDSLYVDSNARMDLGRFIQFEEIEQFGTDIGKIGTFADSFIGFTQAGSMILYTGEGVPATSIGDPGTPIGAIAIDSNYIYYCVAEYDGVTDIWRRTPWAESSW